MEITLNLPDKIFLHASKFAKKTRRSFDEVVSESLQKFSGEEMQNSLSKSTDAEVLEAAKLWIPENQSARHSKLLEKNQEGLLTVAQQKELAFFQQIYRLALLRKAEGITEALRRGLIQSVEEL